MLLISEFFLLFLYGGNLFASSHHILFIFWLLIWFPVNWSECYTLLCRYKFTLFNELYFLVAGGTVWIGTNLSWTAYFFFLVPIKIFIWMVVEQIFFIALPSETGSSHLFFPLLLHAVWEDNFSTPFVVCISVPRTVTLSCMLHGCFCFFVILLFICLFKPETCPANLQLNFAQVIKYLAKLE